MLGWMHITSSVDACRQMKKDVTIGPNNKIFCFNAFSPGFTDMAAIHAVQYVSLRGGREEGGGAGHQGGVCVFMYVFAVWGGRN